MSPPSDPTLFKDTEYILFGIYISMPKDLP